LYYLIETSPAKRESRVAQVRQKKLLFNLINITMENQKQKTSKTQEKPKEEAPIIDPEQDVLG